MNSLIRLLLTGSKSTRRDGPRVAIAIRIHGQTRIIIGREDNDRRS